MIEYIKRQSAFRVLLNMLLEHEKTVKEWLWTPASNMQKGRIAYKVYMQELHIRRVKEKMPTLFQEAVEIYMRPTWLSTQSWEQLNNNFSIYGIRTLNQH